MNEPRQLGTLGGFIGAATEMEPGLRIDARQPWTHRSAAVATRAMQARSEDYDDKVIALTSAP